MLIRVRKVYHIPLKDIPIDIFCTFVRAFSHVQSLFTNLTWVYKISITSCLLRCMSDGKKYIVIVFTAFLGYYMQKTGFLVKNNVFFSLFKCVLRPECLFPTINYSQAIFFIYSMKRESYVQTWFMFKEIFLAFNGKHVFFGIFLK